MSKVAPNVVSGSDTGDIVAEAIRFCDDPNKFFNHRQVEMDTISREALAELQLEGLKYRFNQLKNNIPMLKKLADGQGIEDIKQLDDVVPLLFEHTVYKSYPPILLEKNRFKDINAFIQKLTTLDLSGVDVSGCNSIDEWLDVMDRKTELRISMSSGTSGTVSFQPLTTKDLRIWNQNTLAKCFDGKEPEKHLNAEVVFPYFRYGPSIGMRLNDGVSEYIVGSEDRFHAAFPERLSADVLYFAGRLRAAQTKGSANELTINPSLKARLKDFAELQNNMQDHIEEFFDRIVSEYRGKRIYLASTWNLLHSLAERGLAKGIEGVFAPDSVVFGGGGAKGMTPPPNWQQDVARFIGIDKITEGYGMSEIMGSHYKCSEGHWHFAPSVIPFVLDPDTSEPLQRKGVATGRAAYFDLSAETRWGGFITGDEITVNWDKPCPCGRQSFYIEGDIQRYSEKQGGDDKISCAATENAHKEALDFLTNFS